MVVLAMVLESFFLSTASIMSSVKPKVTRITRSSLRGVWLFSVHGTHYLPRLDSEERARFEAGQLVCQSGEFQGRNMCISYHPERYVREILAQGGKVESVSMVAEFANAQFDAAIPTAAFQFAVPQGAEQVEWFRPHHPAQLLGQKLPQYVFFDHDACRFR